MTVPYLIKTYLADDRGAITVDWTVLSSAAVGLAIATTAIMTDTIDMLSGRMDGELRSRQMSDVYIQFQSNHFEVPLAAGAITEQFAESLYDIASGMMNNDIITTLQYGITAMEEGGEITESELLELIAVASVAHQRNIVDDGVLDHYFGLDGGDPFYMTIANAPVAGSG